MNKIILTVILSAVSTVLFAQIKVKKSEVPDAVVKAYLNQNSNGSKDTFWEKEVISIYKVKFMEDNRLYESQYSSDGHWIKTYTTITQDELPMLAMNHIRATYPEFSIKQCTIVLNNNGKLYMVDLQKGNNVITEQFLMSGKVFR